MKKVLVVDDEAFIRKMIEVRLKDAGFSVVEAQNGHEALEKVLSEKPSVIIMDVMMPGMDGFQACEMIRGTPEISDTPILMLTARGQMIDMERAMALGVREYITKPFSPRKLTEKVIDMLGAVRHEK